LTFANTFLKNGFFWIFGFLDFWIFGFLDFLIFFLKKTWIYKKK